MGAFGEAHPRTTVTEDQVRQIIQLLQTDKIHKEIADQFGVSRAMVQRIASGRSWQHIPRPPNFDATVRHKAKLTEDQAREIRRLRKAGHSTAKLVGKFGVAPSTIRRIVAGRSWCHLVE